MYTETATVRSAQVKFMNPLNQDKVTTWLREQGVDLACGVCGSTDWQLHDQIIAPSKNDGYEPSGSRRVSARFGGTIYPPSIRLAAVICNNCAGVTFLHADTMGL